ncbi:Maf family protein [Desulfotalea psychrophila]|uniref:dTTP/UTP pyrophosphatase n=1 Tax=Desulfotalea psychrophila (strain LSv54 / DSM 12343) TaxID=177439 RepID=NTPPA_DESPS|nr:Maf family protein [Desulfotalea psychrophila]Q6AMI5.1 RecName: Full=dTTP/UTP pyrophosphatase; Short=dTTPase/UTPase; AltName: Full=Nucleoside triphosphate pyrophosphatase; AltName: Full=Nucleotide pyrophosphatase; Short=Nucleotide PPase [Desulfotalea psychrophila LSv54]CAG36440.1 probable septum formation protein Maf [Desulfotalea psychrophila LSv54]
MYKCDKPLILASSSPRRKAFLDQLGLEYSVRVKSIDEFAQPEESPEAFVCRMALEKGSAVSYQHPDSWVIAADTIVCLDQKILGKPRDSEDAVAMLCRLAGRSHTVMTAFAIICEKEKISEVQLVETSVYFSSFGEVEARAYVATGEPLDKAGSYGIQGVGALFVRKIAGSYSNVVGLPLAELVERLLYYSVISI